MTSRYPRQDQAHHGDKPTGHVGPRTAGGLGILRPYIVPCNCAQVRPLLRSGRLDRKIEIPLPNEQGRLEILKIYGGPVSKY